MTFRELTEQEFDIYSKNCPQRSYVQSVEMARLKKQQGNNPYFVGVLEKDQIIAATMMFSIKTHFNKYIFYAPRGLLVNYHNLEVLKFFTKEIKKYIKIRHGIKLIIDPKEIYKVMDSDGKLISKTNNLAINNLRTCGYRHFGFNKNFETIQVRHEAILEISGTYEEMLSTFTKTTRKHILDLSDNAIKVRKGTKEDLKIMEQLFTYTAENKNFEHKNLDYYEKMYDVMPNIMNIYISYVDFKYEKELLTKQLNDAKEEKNKIEIEMQKINVGAKMLKKLELANNKIVKISKQIEDNKDNLSKYGQSINIGALLSIESGDEYISLTSGMLSDFKNYNPKYAMYNEHIKDAINKDKKIVNFYGISGNLDSKNELYKIYELKKGFNPKILELIGQFDLPTHFLYYIYDLITRVKRIIKK